jgi:hypothetical protein
MNKMWFHESSQRFLIARSRTVIKRVMEIPPAELHLMSREEVLDHITNVEATPRFTLVERGGTRYDFEVIERGASPKP